MQVFNLPSGVTGLAVNYESHHFSDLQSVLNNLSDASIVITGFELEPAYDAFAVSWMQTKQTGGFDSAMHTVLAGEIQSAAAQEGQLGRVITAISYNAGKVSYLSYGWQSDKTTVYETSVASASKATAASAAVNFASQGYIITAIGGNDSDGVLIVGTRVKGDSIARPIMVIPGGQSPLPLAQRGYATVAIIFSSKDGFIDWVGER